jgi:hypothetical protein
MSEPEDTFQVELTGIVGFNLTVRIDAKPIGEATPGAIKAAAAAANRAALLMRGAREQIEALIFAELQRRVPHMKFGADIENPGDEAGA